MAEGMEGITQIVSEYGVKISDVISSAIQTGIETGTLGVQELLSNIGVVQGDYNSKTQAEEAALAENNKKTAWKMKVGGTEAGQIKSLLDQLEQKKIISNKLHDAWNNRDKANGGTDYSLNAISNLIAKDNVQGALKQLDVLIDRVTKRNNSGSTKGKLGDLLKKLAKWKEHINAGYATGVHNLKEDQIAWTQEFGDEAILSPTRNAILTPLKSGDSVLTKAQTENLFKFAKNPLDFLNNLNKISNVTNSNTTSAITLNIDNVLTVQGDVNDSNAKEIAAIAQQAITKAFNDFSSKIKK